VPTLNLSRRTLLAGISASIAMPARAAESGLEKIRVSIIPINDVAPLFSAIKNGYFREQGLDIDTTPSTGGATGIPGLIGGSFDIVYGNVVSELLAAQQGLDIKVVAPGTKVETADTDTTQIVVRSDSDIKSGKDLEGKSIAVNTRNNVIWLYARAWVKATGGNPDRVTYREVPFPQMEDALRQKQVDAAYIVAPFSVIALGKSGLQAIGKPYSEVQPGIDIGQYLTIGKYLADKSQTIDKFVKGLRRGIEWYNANRKSPELLEIVAGYTKIDISLLKTLDLTPAPLRIDPAQMKKTMELMIENKLLRAPVDIAKIIAPTAL
jgi:NitT/TauT family transport system substrate-binding protein